LLKQVGQILEKSVRTSADTVCRLGGDEFIIILGNLLSKQVSIQVAKKLISLLSNEIIVEGHTINISASIGIAVTQDFTESPFVLMKKADAAMYDAKAKGKNRYSVAS
jgi:diguanylate cyclase (GGDEF)-like protein